MAPARQLILGTIDNYRVKDICVFVESIRNISYRGTIVLFGKHVDTETRAYLRRHDVHFQTARYYGKATRRAANLALAAMDLLPESLRTTWGRSLRARTLPCFARRYFNYLDYLDETSCDHVMITDVRDVVFQCNPFEDDKEGDLAVFEEHPSQTVRSEHYNRNWILNLYGEKALDDIGDHRVICSGVTLGSRDGMVRYLRAMCRELMLRSGEPGYDQGVHNYLIRTDAIGPVRIAAYGQGVVGHLGITPPSEIELSNSNEVLDRCQNPYPVVHQYDRHESLAKRYSGKYGAGKAA